MCMEVFDSRRMRWMPRSERIWPPSPMAIGPGKSASRTFSEASACFRVDYRLTGNYYLVTAGLDIAGLDTWSSVNRESPLLPFHTTGHAGPHPAVRSD